MKYLIIIILTFLVVFGCNDSPNSKKTNNNAKSTSKYVLSKTVTITMQDKYKQTSSFGSGFILEPSLVITNRHVIENATFGFVEFENKKHKIEGYVAVDRTNDLVILKVPSLVQDGIKQFNGILETGEKVYVAGNPQGLAETVTTGIVSNPQRIIEEKELVQISAPISPGSSGGPVVNEFGELIGVAVGALTDGQNLNFAVPTKFIDNLKQNTKTISALNIQTTKKKIDDIISTDPQDWIVLRRFEYNKYIRFGAAFEKYLSSFSILNKTEWPISSILVLLISYDDTKIPIDYKIYRFFPNDPILPSLAKTVDIKHYIGKASKNSRIEYRILDYVLHNE